MTIGDANLYIYHLCIRNLIFFVVTVECMMFRFRIYINALAEIVTIGFHNMVHV